MSVRNYLQNEQKIFTVSDGVVDGWIIDNTDVHGHGLSSLAVKSTTRQTVKLNPQYVYASPHQKRVWIGTNNIPYESFLDGLQLCFTVFAQVNSGGKAKIVIYHTEDDPDHQLSPTPNSWFQEWTSVFPHDDDLTGYPFPSSHVDLETHVESLGITYSYREININPNTSVIDGYGLLSSNKWNVLRSEYITVPTNRSIRNLGVFIEIVFDDTSLDNNESVAFLSYPSLISRLGATQNEIAAASYLLLPEVFLTNDSRNELDDARLYRIMDVMSYGAFINSLLADAFRYVDTAEGYDVNDLSTYSILVSPVVAPLPILYWLSQFISTKRDFVQPTSTPWSALPETWQGYIDTLDENADTEVSWTEIETYSPSFTILESYLRWAITTGYVGINAGTIDAVTESVKKFLSGAKTVTIDKRPGNDPFTIKLYTLHTETPDSTGIGGTSAAVTAAIQNSKSLGVYIEHEID